jgi:hypothetical protein
MLTSGVSPISEDRSVTAVTQVSDFFIVRLARESVLIPAFVEGRSRLLFFPRHAH